VIDSNRRGGGGVGGAGGRRGPGAPSSAAVGGARKPAGRDKVSGHSIALVYPTFLSGLDSLLVRSIVIIKVLHGKVRSF